MLKVSFFYILTAIFAKTTPVNAKTVRVSYRKSSYGAATKIQIVRTIKANTSGAEKSSLSGQRLKYSKLTPRTE